MKRGAHFALVSLATALMMPALSALAFEPDALSDAPSMKFWYLVFGAFTTAGAFLVVWPSYVLQPNRRSEWRKTIVVMAVSAPAGILMLLPFVGINWLGAGFALATAALWLTFHRLGAHLSDLDIGRSKPSG